MANPKDHRLRSSFACDICRRIKMRCIPLSGNMSDPKPPCQRCARIGHRCTFQGLDQAPPNGKRKRKPRSRLGKKVNEDKQTAEKDGSIKQTQPDENTLQASVQNEKSLSSNENDYILLLDSPLLPDTASNDIFDQSKINMFDHIPTSQQLQSLNNESIISVSNESFSFSPSSADIGESGSTINSDPSNVFDMDTDDLRSPVSNHSTTKTTETLSVPERMHPLALLAEASLGIGPNLSSSSEAGSTLFGQTSQSHSDTHYSNPGTDSQTPQSSTSTQRSDVCKYWPGNEVPPAEHKMITNNLVSWPEVEKLFQIYFNGCAQHFLILDPTFHTVKLVAQRSSVLLTVICALASRYYPSRPTLHKQLFELSNTLISSSIADGRQSIELIQALLILSMWPLPTSRWEDGKSWIFSGIALRMATELNLHELGSQKNESRVHPSVSIEKNIVEKEIRNQERCYLCCFSVDRSFSTMRGRPTVLPVTPLIREWSNWVNNPICKRWEIGICAFVDLMSMLTEQSKTFQQMQKVGLSRNNSLEPSGQQTPTQPNEGSLLAQIHVFDDKVEEWRERWMKRGLFNHTPLTGSQKRDELEEHLFSSIVEQMPLRYNYAKLIVNSFGLQHCLLTRARSTEIDVLFSRCWRASFNLLNAALEGVRPVIKYLPDTQFLVLCYASVLLLKLRCHPMASVSKTKNVNAVLLVTKVAKLLDSVGNDPNHQPAIYASFLWSILRRISNNSSYQQESNISIQNSVRSSPFNGVNMRQRQRGTESDRQCKEGECGDSAGTLYSREETSKGEKEIQDAFISNLQASLSNPQPLYVQWPEALSGPDFDFGCGNLMEFKENLFNSQEDDVLYQDFWDKVVPSNSNRSHS